MEMKVQISLQKNLHREKIVVKAFFHCKNACKKSPKNFFGAILLKNVGLVGILTTRYVLESNLLQPFALLLVINVY